MTHLEQAINWMELDKRCGAIADHCLKCDAILKERFDTADAQTRNFLVTVRRTRHAVCSEIRQDG
jgi:hypothetical protein